MKFYKNKYKNIYKQQKINCIFSTISIGIKQYIFIRIILLKPDIRKFEVPTLTTKLIISVLEYKMIANFMIVEESYSDSRMTSNSWFRRLASILTLILVGPVDAKGLGGTDNLSPSPSKVKEKEIIISVPTLTTKLIILVLEYKMIATLMIVEDSYSDSRMTSNSWFRRLASILTLILVGPVDAKGLGGTDNLSPSPSNI